MKILFWLFIIVDTIFNLIKSIKKYRNDGEKIELVFIIGSIIMIPSGIILLISEIIDK